MARGKYLMNPRHTGALPSSNFRPRSGLPTLPTSMFLAISASVNCSLIGMVFLRSLGGTNVVDRIFDQGMLPAVVILGHRLPLRKQRAERHHGDVLGVVADALLDELFARHDGDVLALRAVQRHGSDALL